MAAPSPELFADVNAARDQQIRALYQAALERDPAQRAAFVAQLSGTDDELRRSVELMLSQTNPTAIGASSTARGDESADLPAGTQIGQYRIDGTVGRGGMGVVYRATDTKLHRPVAIKFLSSAVADAEARLRFEREAQTASALNHPHIVTVYDVGEHDGRQYIVSELVDGGTLADWAVATRRRSWRQCVDLLTGVADGLAAAHAAGVLHRDVKPGNILIGANGYAKIADFGLAKLVDPGRVDFSRSRQPSKDTRAGVVLGTVAYMSPEQASGQQLDARSDAFSFGIVLYELLAGRAPFAGANELEVLKAVAHAAPAPLPDDVPELLRIAVDKALEKEPADRYQTMQDLVADLRRVIRKPQLGAQAGGARRRARLPWLLAAAAGVLFLAALAPALRYAFRPAPAAAPQIRFDIAAPTLADAVGLAVSPDGRRIAYHALADRGVVAWVRPLDSTDAHSVPGTESSNRDLFWSPDGRKLAFFANGKLKTVDAEGGTPQAMSDEARESGASWGADGTILLVRPSPVGRTGIYSISADGGYGVTPVMTPSSNPNDPLHYEMPVFLPDGKHFLFMAGAAAYPAPHTLNVATRDGRDRVQLLTGGDPNAGAALDGGFLLWVRDGKLLAQSFDTATFALRGEPVSIADNVGVFSVGNGVLAFRGASSDESNPYEETQRHLVWYDHSGQQLGEVETPARYRQPVLSPDGKRVAIAVAPQAQQSEDIWTIDTARGTTTRLTFDPASDAIPVWSPDGTQIAFASGRGSAMPELPNSIYRRLASGAAAEERLFLARADEIAAPHDWSHDGQYIVFARTTLASFRDSATFWILPTAGGKEPYPLIDVPFPTSPARFSPNGRWIAYAVDESAGFQVVVQPFPDAKAGKWQVSTRGGYNPRWSVDGRELYYVAPDGTIMAVDVQDGPSFDSGPPRPLFNTSLRFPGGGQGPELLFDVSPDGRFLVNEPVAGKAPDAAQTIHVILNWRAGLAR